MAAIPRAQFIIDWFNQFEASLLREWSETLAKNKREGVRIPQNNGEWPPYILGNRAFQSVIQVRQIALDQFIYTTGAKDYAVHEYKLWCIPAEETAFLIQRKVAWYFDIWAKYMTIYSQE